MTDLNARIMKRHLVLLAPAVIMVAVVSLTAPLAYAETPYRLKGCGIRTTTVIDKTEGTTIGHTVGRGTTQSVPPGNAMAFDEMVFECHNIWTATKQGADWSGRCTFIDKDGDRLLGWSKSNDQTWDWHFLGGSGKWQGIQGGGTGVGTQVINELATGAKGYCWEGEGSYTLAK